MVFESAPCGDVARAFHRLQYVFSVQYHFTAKISKKVNWTPMVIFTPTCLPGIVPVSVPMQIPEY